MYISVKTVYNTPLIMFSYITRKNINMFTFLKKKEQAGAEMGQAKIKLGLDFKLISCKFGSSTFDLVKLVGWI